MNNNLGVEGGILSGPPNLRFLELDSSVHQQTQLGHPSHTHTHQIFPSSMNRSDDDQSIGFMETKVLNPKAYSVSFGKGKASTPINVVIDSNNNNMSDEDEPSFMEYGDIVKKGSSPWQRMKWTDSRVRLLIQVVACVGDDGTLEGVEGLKRRSGSLQKKGKWKTVSKMMIAKGCHVSPQQCEDKFNDLNKRYKRLNDILGRGTSCSVVENPSLMDSMPQLSVKMKEDVKKILSSKHLFYPQMCAYHNDQRIPNCNELDLQDHSLSLPIVQFPKESNGSEAEEAEEDDESEDDESDDNNGGEDVEGIGGFSERKCGNETDGFRAEMGEFLQDPNNTKVEKREWVKERMLQLEERRVGIQAEAFEMEKRKFKWQRFCSNKNRELEISKLENERLMLENERMALQMKQMEQEVEFNRHQ